MAHIFLSDLKATLNNCIAELEEIHFMFCKNPESDFTRNRKLSFRDYIQLTLQMQCRALSDNLYCGYRLLACDSSNVNITRDPSDERTFVHEGEKGYNAVHINALYDITNKTYCDFLVQGKKAS